MRKPSGISIVALSSILMGFLSGCDFLSLLDKPPTAGFEVLPSVSISVNQQITLDASTSSDPQGYTLACVDRYLGYAPRDRRKTLIREALKSVAAWAIIPMQGHLGLGADARMNTPSTLGGDWRSRMRAGALTAELAAEMRELFGR